MPLLMSLYINRRCANQFVRIESKRIEYKSRKYCGKINNNLEELLESESMLETSRSTFIRMS